MSEQILLLNPRHKHKRRRANRRRSRKGRMPAGLARYWANKRGANPRRRRRRHSNRRRHARAANPRVLRTGRHYRARSRRRTNRRHYHTRRRRSNPRFHMPRFGGGGGMVGQYLIPAAIGGAGGLALDLIWGYLSPKLPATVQTGYAGLAAKLAVVLGVAFGMNKFMPRLRGQTTRAAIGAGTVLAYGAIKGIAQSVLPATTPGLSGYIDYQSYALPGAGGRLNGYMTMVPRTLGSLEDLYSPAAVIQPPGTAVPRQFGGLRGYIAAQPHMASGGGLMGLDWQSDGM